LAPSPWILRFFHLIPAGGAILDLACGSGRHGRLLLEQGHPVTLLDRDLSGVADLSGRAELIATDLEGGASYPLTGRRFAATIVTNYLWRPLFPDILRGIAPGGLLLYETFAVGNERYGRPRNPDFLLKPGELIDVCRELTIIAYEHGLDDGPAVRQRICAMRNPEGPAPLTPT
jgi:SAM-dependent methyltransferase